MTQHLKDNYKTHDEDRNILTICSLVVWHQMAQSVCRKDAKTAGTFRQRSAESVAKTWKKSVLPFCSKLCNGCFSPSCAGGKNLKISIILCYGCHNYHCYHGHYIILLYSRMKHEHLKCSGSALRGALYNIVVARRQKMTLWHWLAMRKTLMRVLWNFWNLSSYILHFDIWQRNTFWQMSHKMYLFVKDL